MGHVGVSDLEADFPWFLEPVLLKAHFFHYDGEKSQ